MEWRKKSVSRKGGKKKGRGENGWGETSREIRDKTAEKGRKEKSCWQSEKLGLLQWSQPLRRDAPELASQGPVPSYSVT